MSLSFETPSLAAYLEIGGELNAPFARSYTSASDLQSFGSAASVTVGGDSYTGFSLFSLLGGAAGIVPNGGGNNPILRSYVKTTAIDGSQSLISVGEIHTNFGGVGDPFIVAYAKNGTSLAAPTLVYSEDLAGTRNVLQLASLEVKSVPRPPVGPGGPSTQFTLAGIGIASGTFDLAALQTPSARVPATTVLDDVTFLSGANPNGPHDYKGVKLWDLLILAGLDPNALPLGYLLATGSDGYQTFFSLAELDPARNGTEVLVAYGSSEFLPDENSLGGAGFARLVVPGDLRGGRYVSNLVALEIQAVPEPHTWTLMLLGVALVGVVSLRKRARRNMLVAN